MKKPETIDEAQKMIAAFTRAAPASVLLVVLDCLIDVVCAGDGMVSNRSAREVVKLRFYQTVVVDLLSRGTPRDGDPP